MSADWLTALEGPLRESFLGALRELALARLRTLPPPRAGRLPLGHELAIARRRARGRSCHLHPSGLSRRYRARLAPRDDAAFAALMLGEPLAASAWIDLIGAETTASWREAGLLAETGAGLGALFRVVVLGESVLATDPLSTRFSQRVHVGLDTERMLEFIEPRLRSYTGSILDVGTGTGALLLEAARLGGLGPCRGLDVNPRAVAVARLNAALNDREAVIEERDVFDAEPARVDLVTWNTPFRFFPERLREHSLDGFGGALGIEVGLRFVERLPRLLAEGGEAFLMTAGPVQTGGGRPLDEALRERAGALALDLTLLVLGSFWDAEHRAFHASAGVSRFESAILHAAHGRGGFARVAPPALARLGDALRWLSSRAPLSSPS